MWAGLAGDDFKAIATIRKCQDSKYQCKIPLIALQAFLSLDVTLSVLPFECNIDNVTLKYRKY